MRLIARGGNTTISGNVTNIVGAQHSQSTLGLGNKKGSMHSKFNGQSDVSSSEETKTLSKAIEKSKE